eukprot:3504626-Pleurochrysis_carterae.AAC.1
MQAARARGSSAALSARPVCSCSPFCACLKMRLVGQSDAFGLAACAPQLQHDAVALWRLRGREAPRLLRRPGPRRLAAQASMHART